MVTRYNAAYAEYPDPFHQRMQSAYEALALCYYFVLVGSPIATDKQRAAEPRIRAKMLQLARFY